MTNSSESSSKASKRIPTRTVRPAYPSLGLPQPEGVTWSHICPHCARAFPSCHALGGHQNAHRQLKKHAAVAAAAAIGFFRTRSRLLAAPPNSTDLKKLAPAPVKPVPVRVCQVMPGMDMKKPPVEINFIPGATMAVSDEEGSRLQSDESVEVDSNWELDLDLKL